MSAQAAGAKRLSFFFTLMLVGIWLTACSSSDKSQIKESTVAGPIIIQGQGGGSIAALTPMPPNGWVFEKKAVTFLIRAGSDLNLFQERSHTLMLGIYQLSDPNGFNKLTGSKEGLQELLNTESFDPSGGIVASEKRIIRPATEELIILDRAESAQYIGIVAGFFELIPGQVSRLIRIPEIHMTTKKTGFARLNPFADPPPPPPPRPGRLKVLIVLNNYRINMTDIYAD